MTFYKGTLSANFFSGVGSSITNLNASNIASGTLPAGRFDDASHGNRSGGSLHSIATTSVAGFMSAIDKATLNDIATYGVNPFDQSLNTDDSVAFSDVHVYATLSVEDTISAVNIVVYSNFAIDRSSTNLTSLVNFSTNSSVDWSVGTLSNQSQLMFVPDGGSIATVSFTKTGGIFASGFALSQGSNQIQTSSDLQSISFANANGNFYVSQRSTNGQRGLVIDSTNAYGSTPTFFLDAGGRFYLNPEKIASLDASQLDSTLTIGGKTNVNVATFRSSASNPQNFIVFQQSGGNTVARVDNSGNFVGAGFTGSGANLTGLTKTQVGLSNVQNVDTTNAANITSGTVATARLGSGTADSTTYLRGDSTWQAVPVNHTQNTDTGTTATSFQIDTGNTGPRIKNITGVITIRNAGDTANAALTASAFTGDGSALTGLTKTQVGLSNVANVDTTNATNITTGILGTARMGSGSPSSTTYLRGDGTWQAISGISHTQNTDTGTTSSSFQLDSGTGGPRIKNLLGTITVRNGPDSSNANFAAASFIGGGSQLTALNASNISTGTLDSARIPTLPYLKLDGSTPLTGTLTFTNSGTAFGSIQFGSGSSVYFDAPNGLTLNGNTSVNGTFYASGGLGGNGSSLTNLNASNISSGTVAPARLGSGTADSTTYLRGDGTWQSVPVNHTQNTDTGTTATSFQIDSGNTGPRIKNIAGVLTVRNAADSANAALTASAFTGDGSALTGLTKAQVGLGNVANVDTTNATNITTGVLPVAQVPDLSATYLTKSGNLAGLANTTTARTNLGLGSVATFDYGVNAGQVPVLGAGSSLIISGVMQAGSFSGNGSSITSLNAANISSGILLSARFDDTSHGNRSGGTLHAVATTSVAGFMSAADKTSLNNYVSTGGNPFNQSLNTTNSVAFASLNVNQTTANNLVATITGDFDGNVGTGYPQLTIRGKTSSSQNLYLGYITTSNYGIIQTVNSSTVTPLLINPQGGEVVIGTTPSGATNRSLTTNGDISTSGTFIGSGASLTGLTKTQVGLGNVANVDTTNAANISIGILPAARFDDTTHGNRSGGSLHALATTSVAGFMSATDKTAINTYISNGGNPFNQSLNTTNSVTFAGSTINGNETVSGTLSSSKYYLGSDLGLFPIGGQQSVIQSYWGLQLVGNRLQVPQSYTPAAIGGADDFSVIIPNQQASKIGLVVQGAASQTGNLQVWRNSSLTNVATVSSTGGITASSFAGDGSAVTSLNATNLTSGTLPAARFNDTSHGNRGGGSLHFIATTSLAGFMSAADKTNLDNLVTAGTGNPFDQSLNTNDSVTFNGVTSTDSLTVYGYASIGSVDTGSVTASSIYGNDVTGGNGVFDYATINQYLFLQDYTLSQSAFYGGSGNLVLDGPSSGNPGFSIKVPVILNGNNLYMGDGSAAGTGGRIWLGGNSNVNISYGEADNSGQGGVKLVDSLSNEMIWQNGLHLFDGDIYKAGEVTAQKVTQRIDDSGFDQIATNYILFGITNNATPTAISEYIIGNTFVLSDNATWYFKAKIVARCHSSLQSASYILEGVVDRNTGAGTIALVTTPIKTIVGEDATAWDASINVNTTTGGFSVVVTGEAGKTIKWLAVLETVQIIAS